MEYSPRGDLKNYLPSGNRKFAFLLEEMGETGKPDVLGGVLVCSKERTLASYLTFQEHNQVLTFLDRPEHTPALLRLSFYTRSIS